MQKCNPIEEIAITGIIAPAEWNDDGEITRLMIADEEENEYTLKKTHIAEVLFGWLRQKVSIQGHLINDEHKLPMIEILGFHLCSAKEIPPDDERVNT